MIEEAGTAESAAEETSPKRDRHAMTILDALRAVIEDEITGEDDDRVHDVTVAELEEWIRKFAVCKGSVRTTLRILTEAGVVVQTAKPSGRHRAQWTTQEEVMRAREARLRTLDREALEIATRAAWFKGFSGDIDRIGRQLAKLEHQQISVGQMMQARDVLENISGSIADLLETLSAERRGER